VKQKPSSREKLIIRLERFLQHNLEHADMLARLAEEAGCGGDLPTAKLIHTAEASFFDLNKPLEKAITRLKNEAGDSDPKRGRSRMPKKQSAPDNPQPRAAFSEKRKCRGSNG
jgi:hypothetical protein